MLSIRHIPITYHQFESTFMRSFADRTEIQTQLSEIHRKIYILVKLIAAIQMRKIVLFISKYNCKNQVYLVNMDLDSWALKTVAYLDIQKRR